MYIYMYIYMYVYIYIRMARRSAQQILLWVALVLCMVFAGDCRYVITLKTSTSAARNV